MKDVTFRQVQGTQRATTWTSPGAPEPGSEPEPEQPPGEPDHRRHLAISREHLVELAVIIILAVATIGTAWNGYQATRWSGVQAADYVTANFLRVESTKAATRAGQDRLYDSQVFSQWLNAFAADDHDLASIYRNRFRAEFVLAFDAWLAAEPFTDPSAPPGPLFMSEYRSQQQAASDILEDEAVATFEAGSHANEVADSYVLNTVFLASALFLAGIASRFTWAFARASTLAIATITLVLGLLSMFRLPID